MLVSEFITAVRRQGKITTDTTDAEILATGDMEIQGRLIPLLRLSHQEYFVAEIQASSSNGRIALPARSILGAVRHVQLTVGGQTQRLPQVPLEDDYLGVSAGLPSSWYFDGGNIVLLPRGTDGTVRLRYYLRPSKMVVETDTGSVVRITGVTTGSSATSLTLDNGSPNPTGFDFADVVSNRPSHNLCVLDTTSDGTNPLSVPNSLIIAPIFVGDWLPLAGFTPVVPVPEELFSTLVHQTAYVLLRALGYDDEAGAQKVLATEALNDARALLAPRSEGNPRRMTGGIRRALGKQGSWRR